MRNIYTSIDIGTDTIKIIVCELFHGKINLLASSSIKSRGIKKGLVSDVDEAAVSLKLAIEEIETKLGITIHDVITTIPSYSSMFTLIKGEVNIENEDGIITGDDVVRVLQQGMNIEEVNMEMVTIMPISFILDGREHVKDPKGKVAKTLESRSILVTTPSRNIYSIMKLLDKCGLEAIDISIGGICDMFTLRNREIDDKVGVIINMGSDTTTISLYNKGIIIKDKLLEIGGKSIDNDIAYIYKTSMIEAKKLKEKFAIASVKHASVSDIYDLIAEDGKVVKVNQHEISEIVVARLEEIFAMIKKELFGITSKELDYIIITGGASNMPYLDVFLDSVFKNAKIARTNLVGVRNNKYSSSLGNVVYYISKQKLKGEINGMLDDEEIDKMSSLKGNVLISNESMLGKVAQYFFGE
ncbi:MAG: cell division protein FtsA [Bacilli bacterium]|nr:cell division protein FtsA [Bacilli bacterium]